jgi:hypothetical protein
MASTPMNPLAGPPGPGKYSTRPDLLRMGSTAYGEGVDTQSILQGAALSKTPDVRGVPAGAVRAAAAEGAVTPLYAPTQRPSEPITHGIDIGDGGDSSVLGMRPVTTEKLSDILAKMLPYDESGEVEILYQRALARGM